MARGGTKLVAVDPVNRLIPRNVNVTGLNYGAAIKRRLRPAIVTRFPRFERRN